MIFLTRHLASLSCWKCLLLLAFVPSVFALSQRETHSNNRVPSRREFVSKAIPTLLLAGSLDVKPSFALKERNAALCGNGFFTNIGNRSRTIIGLPRLLLLKQSDLQSLTAFHETAQYLCTEIGDISDEGKSRKMSNEEIGSMESLLGKMGVGDEVDDVKEDHRQSIEEKKENRRNRLDADLMMSLTSELQNNASMQQINVHPFCAIAISTSTQAKRKCQTIVLVKLLARVL
jgi:hypothetical protein